MKANWHVRTTIVCDRVVAEQQADELRSVRNFVESILDLSHHFF